MGSKLCFGDRGLIEWKRRHALGFLGRRKEEFRDVLWGIKYLMEEVARLW
ncbi:hypothetical protein KAR91_38690 [Candidatus Pacearchaeota archaeon]|nr:hypothetical protein [Candidatus Pacearchaeota archaeon]